MLECIITFFVPKISSILFFPSVVTCNQERNLQRLLLIQPRIAVCRVIEAEIFFGKALASTNALRYRIPCQLQMHSPQKRAVLFVDPERRGYFLENAAESPRLDAFSCCNCVSTQPLACHLHSLEKRPSPMHWITLPHNRMPAPFDGFDVVSQTSLNLALPIPCN